MPVQSVGSRAEKSPSRTASSARSSSRRSAGFDACGTAPLVALLLLRRRPLRVRGLGELLGEGLDISAPQRGRWPLGVGQSELGSRESRRTRRKRGKFRQPLCRNYTCRTHSQPPLVLRSASAASHCETRTILLFIASALAPSGPEPATKRPCAGRRSGGR